MRRYFNETREIDTESPSEKRARFMAKALQCFDSLPVGWEGLSELWKCYFDLIPPSPGCWGAFVSYLKQTGRVVATGERRKMVTPRSHNRKTDVLRKVM